MIGLLVGAAVAVVAITLTDRIKPKAVAQNDVRPTTPIAEHLTAAPEEKSPAKEHQKNSEHTSSGLDKYLRTVEGEYGLVLGSFNIPQERLTKIKKLLAERKAAFSDLAELRGSPDLSVMYGARVASGNIDKDFKKEIRTALTPAEWQNVGRMLEIEVTLLGVEHEIANPLYVSGEPLSGNQLFLVADLLDAKFRNPPGEHPDSPASVDPSSRLSKRDESVLAQLDDLLSPSQIARVKAFLTSYNERFLGPSSASK